MFKSLAYSYTEITPSIVSWSAIAIVDNFRFTEKSTKSLGLNFPSDAFV